MYSLMLRALAARHGGLPARVRLPPARATCRVFVVLLALMLYTHNWGLFLAAGSSARSCRAGTCPRTARAFWRDALIGFGVRRAALPALGAHAAPPDPAHRRALAQLAELRRADPDLEGRCSAAARRPWRCCWPAARASPP